MPIDIFVLADYVIRKFGIWRTVMAPLVYLSLGGWSGYKKMLVTKKVKETDDITSFYIQGPML
jgi:hypothetical protein